MSSRVFSTAFSTAFLSALTTLATSRTAPSGNVPSAASTLTFTPSIVFESEKAGIVSGCAASSSASFSPEVSAAATVSSGASSEGLSSSSACLSVKTVSPGSCPSLSPVSATVSSMTTLLSPMLAASADAGQRPSTMETERMTDITFLSFFILNLQTNTYLQKQKPPVTEAYASVTNGCFAEIFSTQKAARLCRDDTYVTVYVKNIFQAPYVSPRFFHIRSNKKLHNQLFLI